MSRMRFAAPGATATNTWGTKSPVVGDSGNETNKQMSQEPRERHVLLLSSRTNQDDVADAGA